MKVLTDERKRHILHVLDRDGMVSVQSLCSDMSTSSSTVRRDLADLEDEGLLERIHGGAKRRGGLRDEPTVRVKANQNTNAKSAIAQAAVAAVSAGDLIFLDAGTTTAHLVPLLHDVPDITVVTPGVDNASLLADHNIRSIMLGGQLKPTTKAVIGAEAAQQLQRFRFNIAFIGTNGIHPDYGVTTPDPEEAAIKRLAIDHSVDTFILADHSKFDQASFSQIVGLRAHTIITTDIETLGSPYNECRNIVDSLHSPTVRQQ